MPFEEEEKTKKTNPASQALLKIATPGWYFTSYFYQIYKAGPWR